MKRRCGACGFPTRKTVRALVITSNEPPRMGLVCKACANCGTLVVCGTLRILPPKPKRVPRSALAKHIREVEEERLASVGRSYANELADSDEGDP